MTTKEQQLTKALSLAKEAHKGQVDKAGADYIEHPMRVSNDCKSIDAKIVAMLHDTVEDCGITPSHLLDVGFPDYIVDAILSVTKNQDEEYSNFILRAKNNTIGREVKIYDILDNINLKRLKSVTEKDLERCDKYIKALKILID